MIFGNGSKAATAVLEGVPGNLPEDAAAVFRSRVMSAYEAMAAKTGMKKCSRITIGFDSSPADRPKRGAAGDDESSVEERAERFRAMPPLYDFGFLALPDDLLDDIMAAIDIINVEARVFDEWGLRAIEPFPKTALNFYGPPGTGKTLAAHAVAKRLGRPIICADYSQIESKFHGDGPKNMDALFHAAARDGAVLFIDEADSLLSKRLTNVTQGSEQAINSLRSQLLICLERFRGVVIFATNLVENYDRAFETRVRHIRFAMPDAVCRRRIWAAHLPESLPRASCVCLDSLGEIEDICGRDIKNAVIDTAVRAARAGSDAVTLADLSGAVERIKAGRMEKSGQILDADEKADAEERIKTMLAGDESGECGGGSNA